MKKNIVPHCLYHSREKNNKIILPIKNNRFFVTCIGFVFLFGAGRAAPATKISEPSIPAMSDGVILLSFDNGAK